MFGDEQIATTLSVGSVLGRGPSLSQKSQILRSRKASLHHPHDLVPQDHHYHGFNPRNCVAWIGVKLDDRVGYQTRAVWRGPVAYKTGESGDF